MAWKCGPISRTRSTRRSRRRDGLHGNSGRAGRGVAGEGVTRRGSAMRGEQGLRNLLAEDCGAQRNVAAGQSFGGRHNVGNDAIVFQGSKGAATARAAHHFVGNQQDSVAVADRSDEGRISGRGGDDSAGGAYHRFEDECGHGFGAEPKDFLFEFGRTPGGDLIGRHAFGWAVGVDWGQQRALDERAFVGGAALEESRDG